MQMTHGRLAERESGPTAHSLQSVAIDPIVTAGTNDALSRLDDTSKVFDADEVVTHALSDTKREIRQGEHVCIRPKGCGAMVPSAGFDSLSGRRSLETGSYS